LIVAMETRGWELEASVMGYFREAVELTSSAAHCFRLADVAFVPWAWQIIDGHLASFGWVVRLRGGHRLYLQYVVDEAGRRAPEDLVVRPLEPGQEFPILSDPAVHWFEPRHVNRFLGLSGQ
jgi:hypothetical protein